MESRAQLHERLSPRDSDASTLQSSADMDSVELSSLPRSDAAHSLELAGSARAVQVAPAVAMATAAGMHPTLRRVLFYLFTHALTLGMLVIAVPTLVLRIYDDDSSRSAYVSSLFAALTALIGFFIYPLWGMLSDHYGRKPFIILSLLGSASSFLIIGIFSNLAALITAAAIRGICDVSYTMSYAVLGDLTPLTRFIRTYGLLAAAGHVGVVLGPLVALACEQVEAYSLGFLVAAGIATVNLIYVTMAVPESLHALRNEAAEAERGAHTPSVSEHELPPPSPHESLRQRCGKHSLNPFAALAILKTSPILWGLALALFMHFLSFTGTLSVVFLFTKERFGWRSMENAAFVFSLGVISIVANALLLPWMQRRCRERTVVMSSIICTLLMQVLWIVTPAEAGWMLFVGLLPLSPGFLLITNIRALIARQVVPEKQGELQGSLACVTSLAAILGPLALNGVFGAFVGDDAPVYIPQAPFILGFILNSISAGLLYWLLNEYIKPASVSTTASAEPSQDRSGMDTDSELERHKGSTQQFSALPESAAEEEREHDHAAQQI